MMNLVVEAAVTCF